MARARNIKPSLFINEELVECDFATRLLFVGLWTLADREGRLEDRPKKIKMALFPADNVDVDNSLNELQKRKFIHRYVVENNQYIQVIAFKNHQNPHKDEKASLIPEFKIHAASTVQAPPKHDANTVANGLIPESLNLIPDLLNPDCLSVIETADEIEKTHTQIQIGLIARGLTAIGMMPFNPTLPQLQALIEAGATVDEFVATAIEKKGTDKFNISYLLTTMTNRRQAAAQSPPLLQGAMPHGPPKTQTIHDKRAATAKAMFGDLSNGNTSRIIDVSDYSTEANRPLISAIS